MNEATIASLEKSFNLLAPRAEELADSFYGTLFSENPGLRPLFPANMTEQKRKLVGTLALAVNNVRAPEQTAEPFFDLGRRQTCAHALAEHHAIIRDTLIEVMREMGGDAWNHGLDRAWQEAIDLLHTQAPPQRTPSEQAGPCYQALGAYASEPVRERDR